MRMILNANIDPKDVVIEINGVEYELSQKEPEKLEFPSFPDEIEAIDGTSEKYGWTILGGNPMITNKKTGVAICFMEATDYLKSYLENREK